MAAGRRRESRLHAITQAALVWGLGEIDPDAFIRTGEMEKRKPQRRSPEIQAAIDRKIDEIIANDGKLFVR